MERLELNGSVNHEGRLVVPLRDMINEWCRINIGKDVKMQLEVRRRTRSNPQNAYYWGVCVPLIQYGIKELGHLLSKEETHEFLKKEFNNKEIDLDNGHFLNIPGSTTEMNTVDFMVFLERIRLFAADMLNVYIPDPNEQTTIDFKSE